MSNEDEDLDLVWKSGDAGDTAEQTDPPFNPDPLFGGFAELREETENNS